MIKNWIDRDDVSEEMDGIENNSKVRFFYFHEEALYRFSGCTKISNR